MQPEFRDNRKTHIWRVGSCKGIEKIILLNYQVRFEFYMVHDRDGAHHLDNETHRFR